LIFVKAQPGLVPFTERMIGRSRKRPAPPKGPEPSQRDKKHLDELLDEALEETFPASDPPAMLEPVPESPQVDEDG
jgi:hypothetical protein